MRRRLEFAVEVLVAGTAIAILTACGGSSNVGPSNGPPQDSVKTQVAQGVAEEISSGVESLTQIGVNSLFGSFLPSGDVQAAAERLALARIGPASVRRPPVHASDLGPNCPTVTPAVPADADGDGVPDQATYTFTAANCTDTQDGLVATGTLSIVDPTPNTASLDYAATVDTLSATFSTAKLEIGGNVAVGETPGQITLQVNDTLSVTETSPQQITDGLAESVSATYTFPAGQTLLVENDPVPAGTLSLTGNLTYNVGAQTYSFTAATTTDLAIDPNCATSVTSGVVTVTFTGTSSGTETITWTACGVYTLG
ncbi:MAG: hypothetical protein ACREND_03125 [Gemmatimonadaceae bacterium]